MIPLQGDFPVPQGANPNGNSTFRAYKFDPDFSGFDGIDLISGDVIEDDSDPLPCITSSNENIFVDLPSFSFTYSNEEKELNISNPNGSKLNLFVFDGLGNKVQDKKMNADERIPISFSSGIYFVQLLENNENNLTGKIIVID